MKELKPPRSGLWTFQWGTRFIYTCFLVFCLLSYAVMLALMATRSGFSPEALHNYYAGNEAAGQYGKTFGELLEVTHFHLFSIPLMLFIQGHIFLLTAWNKGPKVTVVVLSFLGGLLQIAGPWMLAYSWPGAAWAMLLGRLLLAGSFVLFFVVPIYEMWFAEKFENLEIKI